MTSQPCSGQVGVELELAEHRRRRAGVTIAAESVA